MGGGGGGGGSQVGYHCLLNSLTPCDGDVIMLLVMIIVVRLSRLLNLAMIFIVC